MLANIVPVQNAKYCTMYKTPRIPVGAIRIASIPGVNVYGDDFDFFVSVKNGMVIVDPPIIDETGGDCTAEYYDVTARTDDAQAVMYLVAGFDNGFDVESL